MRPSKFWRIVVDIYEPGVGDAYPVVRHIFSGRSEAEARRYCAAHMKADSFMRDCLRKSRWKNIECVPSVTVLPPSPLLASRQTGGADRG